MPRDLVGRIAELAEIDRFLGAISTQPARPSGMVLEGSAGIGKSSLWSAAVEHARGRGILVLAARPSEAEASYGFQALGDLFEPILAEVAALPAPQRHNLEIALLRREPESTQALDPQAVAVAAGNVLRGAALQTPILIAIDDAPWLDPASAGALAFIVRRLADRSIGVLLAQRVDAPGSLPLELDRAVPTERLWLGPLGRADLHLLLASRLDLVLPRATLARLHEQSQGNAFHALEIARALQRLPVLPRPGEDLPVPESIRALVDARLSAVSTEARRILLLAALAGSPSLPLLNAAERVESEGLDPRPPRPLGVHGVRTALDESADAGIVTVEGSIVRFTHPLIASTLVAGAGGGARRAAHRALATVAPGPQERGRHLGLSTTAPDAVVANSLELAATDASRRGASEAAVELFRLAAEQTPDSEPEARLRRRVRLGIALSDQADLTAAAVVLDEATPQLPPGRLLAEACIVRSSIAWYLVGGEQAVTYLDQALGALGRATAPDSTAPDDPELAELVGRIHLRIGQFTEDVPRSRVHRAAAIAILERTPARTSYATGLMMLFWADVALGRAPDLSLLERGLALEVGGHADSTTLPGLWWTHTDQPAQAIERFEWMRRVGHEIGELSGDADLLTQMAQANVYADDWPRARELIDDARMLATQEGQAEPIGVARVRALLDVHEGRLDEAESVAAAGAARTFEAGDVILGVAFLHVLTLVAAARGDARRVEEVTADAVRRLASIRWVEPLRPDPAPERIEALVALGRLDEAETLLADLERRGQVLPRPWVDAAVARGRALLLAARGDAAGAIASTEAAMDNRSASWRSFDRARTLLVRGQVLRGFRRPRDAGLALDVALEIFERLGAPAWADRTNTELRRLGRRRPGHDNLTPAEAQVAALAASGLRNHEVAARLSVSPKTVEAHLARVYAKLGIRSRAELGRSITDRPPP